jgi:polar amino acid transport system permease protein
MKRRTRQRLTRGAMYGIFLAVVAAAALFADWERIGFFFFNVELARSMFPEVITTAAKNTLWYTVSAFAGGLGLGLALALMKLSTIRPYRWFASGYIELFRGLPALVTIFLVGLGLPLAFDWAREIPVNTRGIIGLALVAGAYMAETIRAGIEGVPRGQMEAARSLGMSHTWAMTSIIIPQAFRLIIPPMTNELVLLLKDTSLLFVLGTTVAGKELTKFGRDLLGTNSNPTPLLVIALVYLAITLPLTRLVAVLEARNRRSR